jgi:hypothetical protein
MLINNHIFKNHLVPKLNKSTFLDIYTAKEAIYSTLCQDYFYISYENVVKEKTFYWPFGFEGARTLHTCRVVLSSSDNRIIAAYPVKTRNNN